MKTDGFGARATFETGEGSATLYRLSALEKAGLARDLERLPFSIRVLLEAVLRNVDGELVTADDVKNLAAWNAASPRDVELPFMPARVILQDFTGVPAVVDLASMRGGDEAPRRRPEAHQPARAGGPGGRPLGAGGRLRLARTPSQKNAEIEFERNRERYEFLRWGQKAFANFRVVPPATGIVHQVNLEYLAKGVLTKKEDGATVAFPDTLVGTDSHTTMINGLGVLGWGVGGIEAEAAMLGQPLYMVTPQVIGFKLVGRLRGGRHRDRPRAHRHPDAAQEGGRREVRGVLRPRPRADEPGRPRHDREHGPRVRRHLRLLPGGRRDAALPATHRPRRRRGGRWSSATARSRGSSAPTPTPDPVFTDTLELDLGTVEPSLAGPKRPQDRVALAQMKDSFREGPHGARQGAGLRPRASGPLAQRRRWRCGATRASSRHGAVVIAAITSCTNTSNPSVMLGAGLLARKAVARGLRVPGYVKTSLAPGSKVVTEYLTKSGLHHGPRGSRLQPGRLRLHHLHRQQRPAAARGREGGQRRQARGRRRALRQPQLRGPRQSRREGQLPGLAAAGRGLRARRHDRHRPREGAAGHATRDGKPVMLAEIWPTPEGGGGRSRPRSAAEMFRTTYGNVFDGNPTWNAIPVAGGRPLRVQGRVDLHPGPALLPGPDPGAEAAHATSRARACSRCSATR